MSILIKGMEMPKSCDKCIYSAWSNFYQIYVCNAVRKNEPVLFDGKQIKSTAVARSARADNCPLIPVPEHGDLIDRDSTIEKISHLSDEIDKKLGYEKSAPYITMALYLSNADDFPTIIPAEEGEG